MKDAQLKLQNAMILANKNLKNVQTNVGLNSINFAGLTVLVYLGQPPTSLFVQTIKNV